ncbi:hypothetical protein BGW39_001997 [Mortierella sp. 14UC]|nr:hypothetical protein BGW39_001997 [Mortierella sp. 14UC]
MRVYSVESAKRCAASYEGGTFFKCSSYGPGIYIQHLIKMPGAKPRSSAIPAKEWFDVVLENIDIMEEKGMTSNRHSISHRPYQDFQLYSESCLKTVDVPAHMFTAQLAAFEDEEKACDFDLLFAFVRYALKYCEDRYDGSTGFRCQGSHEGLKLSMSQTYEGNSLYFYSYWYIYGLNNVNRMDSKNVKTLGYSEGPTGVRHVYGHTSCDAPAEKDLRFDLVFDLVDPFAKS